MGITDRDRQLAYGLFKAFGERRFDELEGTLLSPALVYRHHDRESDIQGWIRDARDCAGVFPDASLFVESEAVQGDSLTLHYRLRGTYHGTPGDGTATGRPIDVPGRSTFRFFDGLIVEVDDYVDEVLLDAQLALT